MHKLEYPYNEDERVNFIVEYNHRQGLMIETVDNYIEIVIDEEEGTTTQENHPTYYALEANEILADGEVIIDPDYEEKQTQKERERIAKLYLTRADVERGIYKAKGMDFEDIIEMVSKEIATGGALAMTLDLKALKIELKANNFYRGNPYVSKIGSLLGFTSEQLDRFFETNDYTVLFVQKEKVFKLDD